jgi:hypothetical protein
VFNEQRTSPRKILKTRAIVTFDGAAPLVARTVDVGGNGVCISYPEPIPPGRACELSFDLFMEGKASSIKTRSKASYCIFSNGEYKIGFQFVNLDLSAMTLLAKFLR